MDDVLEQMTQALDARRVRIAVEAFPPDKKRLLGASLSHLYAISTCSRSCSGGDHLLEAIVGRCCNHSIGALRMIADHLYDESMNLTRSIAEATNLLFLFHEDDEKFEAWKAANRTMRMNSFGPGKVRDLLKNGRGVVPVESAAYQDLCETATHVTPGTRPNRHNYGDSRLGYVGGIFDPTGSSRAVDELLLYSSLCALVACKLFAYHDWANGLAALGAGTFEA